MIPDRKVPNKLQVEFTDDGIRVIIDHPQDAKEILKRYRLGKRTKGPVGRICLHTQVDSFGNPIEKYYLDIRGNLKNVEAQKDS